MDKFEKIKKEWNRIKSGDTLEGINVEWLISEIERLKHVIEEKDNKINRLEKIVKALRKIIDAKDAILKGVVY